MKTKNELILDKLVELGYVELKCFSDCISCYDADIQLRNAIYFDPCKRAVDAIAVLNALISECGKRDLRISIKNNVLVIAETKTVLHLFQGTYNRQSVADAFCKVVGI